MSYRADKHVVTAYTDGHTDRQTQATTIPEGQNWPQVMIVNPLWTKKKLSFNAFGKINHAMNTFCHVCKIKHILSFIHYTIYGAVCFQFTHFPCDDWQNTCTLSYYHHQIGSMNDHPLFRVMSWNSGMHCMTLYIVIIIIWSQNGFSFVIFLYKMLRLRCCLSLHHPDCQFTGA